MKIKFLSLLLVVFAFSCKSVKTSTKNAEMLESGNYQVTSLNGKDISSNEVRMNINMEEKSISGYSGCNSFSGNLKADKSTFEAGQVVATLRHCEDNQVEDEFLKGISSTNQYILENGILKIKDNNGNIILEAKHVPNELKDGTYKVISVGGKSVEKDSKASIRIDTEQNSFSGNTGCNSFGSEYEIDEDNNLKLGMARVTKMYCDGKMEFESEFLKNVGQIHSFESYNDRLEFRSKDGASLLIAEKIENKE